MKHNCLFFTDGLTDATKTRLATTKGKKGKSAASNPPPQQTDNLPPIQVILEFKRYMYDPQKKMVQS